MRYEILEHTADQALRATGHDLRELIENAAAGMISLLYAEAPPPPEQELERTIEADSPELLLHHSLRELLYLLEDEGLAPVAVRVVAATDARATLEVGVISRDAAEPLLGGALKAVTRHRLDIDREENMMSITIVFDV
jgi:SHS2 domain-containing protein